MGAAARAGRPAVIGGHQPQPPPPRRTAVSGPRRHRPGGWSARARPADLHAQPRLGQVYVRSLVRDQLRLALGVLTVLAVVLGGVPAAFALLPGLRTAEVFGFRLAWLLLGVVAYPVLLGMAWFHVRHAERVERDFTELLRGPDPTVASQEPDGAQNSSGGQAGSDGVEPHFTEHGSAASGSAAPGSAAPGSAASGAAAPDSATPGSAASGSAAPTPEGPGPSASRPGAG
ncbi:hypothetical protein OG896_21610 [Streptomyces sp. NBC_00669]|uniref:hypothetical protein n=1 Tax=Streptomyces sp. NBC_00669 TaxID=2976011 RepID=UPI002E36C6BA|nr:hypothetical protein [Streptomyces sp. NBC_00669]